MTSDLILLTLSRIETPVGQFLVLIDDAGRLRAANWTDYADRMESEFRAHFAQSRVRICEQNDPFGHSARLAAYFGGDLRSIEELPAEPEGTEFQRTVWQALRAIPCGETISYAELARRIGRPAAVRAVGAANGANPISVVLPCHRVIGANGALTGYGGGIERKRWLLTHEGAWNKESLFPEGSGMVVR